MKMPDNWGHTSEDYGGCLPWRVPTGHIAQWFCKEHKHTFLLIRYHTLRVYCPRCTNILGA